MEQATVWDAIDRDKFAPEGDVLAQLPARLRLVMQELPRAA